MIAHLRNTLSSLHIVGLDIACPIEHDADEFHAIDFCKKSDIGKLANINSPDIVIHLAGLMPPASEDAMRRVNVEGSVYLAEALKSLNKKIKLVSAGSAAEYLPSEIAINENSPIGGLSPYGRTKSEQSSALLECAALSKLSVVIARPFNLLGPGLSKNLVAGGLCQQFIETGVEQGFIAPRGPVDSIRDFIDVRDVVAAYWLLAESTEEGVFNVCSGEGQTINALIAVLEKGFGCQVEVRPDYDAAMKPDISIGNCERLRGLGWKPSVSFEASLLAMVEETLSR